MREKTCKFISSKLATFGNDELSAETEKYIVMTVKKVRPLTEHSFFPLGYLLAMPDNLQCQILERQIFLYTVPDFKTVGIGEFTKCVFQSKDT